MSLTMLLFALFASIFTLQKQTLGYCEPFFLIGSRMLFAGIILISWAALKRDLRRIKFSKKIIYQLIFLAITNIYVANIFEIWALSAMVSAKVSLLYSLTPFISALVAYFLLKEKLSSRKWLGLLLGFTGLLPLTMMQSSQELATGSLYLTTAEWSVVGAVFFSVVGWVILKQLIQSNVSPVSANGISMLLGGIMALLHSYYSGENWQPFPVNDTVLFLRNSLIMCIISNFVCYNLYGHLLKTYTATFMAFAGLVTPLFAAIFGYIYLQEPISWPFFISLALFCIGLVVFYREEISQGQAYRVSTPTL